MRRFLVSLLLLIVLNACTIPNQNKKYTFRNTDQVGLLAFSNSDITADTALYLNKLNMEAKRFESTKLKINMCANCIPMANTFKLEKTDKPKFYFFQLPAGTYALTGMHRYTYEYTNYCKGTSAFEIEAGKVNFVDMKRGAFPREGTLEKLQNIISQYPGITAEAQIAKIPAVIFYDQVDANGNSCRTSGAFTMTSPEKFRKFRNQIQ